MGTLACTSRCEIEGEGECVKEISEKEAFNTNKENHSDFEVSEANSIQKKNKNENQDNANTDEDEDIISVIFSSLDQKIHFSVACKKDDSFSVVEQKLYKEYSEYKDKEKYFLVNGNKIDVNKSLKENKIKNSDIIMLNTIEDIQ